MGVMGVRMGGGCRWGLLLLVSILTTAVDLRKAFSSVVWYSSHHHLFSPHLTLITSTCLSQPGKQYREQPDRPLVLVDGEVS